MIKEMNLNEIVNKINDEYEMKIDDVIIKKIHDNEISIQFDGFQEIDYFLKLNDNKFIMTSNYTDGYEIIENKKISFCDDYIEMNDIAS